MATGNTSCNDGILPLIDHALDFEFSQSLEHFCNIHTRGPKKRTVFVWVCVSKPVCINHISTYLVDAVG